MGINLVVGVTDGKWFEHLRGRNDAEINFWRPSRRSFKALKPGELFLFKLRYPHNFIVGAGIFTHYSLMPCSLAWESFGEANGAGSFSGMREHIAGYKKENPDINNDFQIGCIILSQPFFLPVDEWIPIPNWSPKIVDCKKYSTDESEGLRLWKGIGERMANRFPDDKQKRFGGPQIIEPRMGRGGFRSLVTDAYDRKCIITKERTLPALDVAHICPFGEGGERKASNGLLLRKDIHSLFDSGYVTVTPDLEFQVSGEIREKFKNGRAYYSLQGKKVSSPKDSRFTPDPGHLEWHNENRFLGR